jgi:oligoendopeptidase F
LNELVHENGHAVHISAIRNRPAFTDWTDTIFTEAFADVPSWSVYEPAWQQKYLGTSIPVGMSLRNLHGSVMMDIAWSLFEIRMLRDAAQDPNALWTDITREYLHIKPHPEVAWWAVRVQLVSRPGYMVNYGLGSILTAEMRKAIADAIGPFDAGNADWYAWTSGKMLRFGSEKSAKQLMDELLGRPLSPEALLHEIRRIR